jgi:pyruvate/2-oxoglutarate dehydrogenase complex dihydrolipoamide acyltransferase (E2) component
MMTRSVIVPRLGSSDDSDEVRVLRWLKTLGDRIEEGEALLEVETDKVNVQIDSPARGILKEIKAREGEFVKCNTIVAFIETPG